MTFPFNFFLGTIKSVIFVNYKFNDVLNYTATFLPHGMLAPLFHVKSVRHLGSYSTAVTVACINTPHKILSMKVTVWSSLEITTI